MIYPSEEPPTMIPMNKRSLDIQLGQSPKTLHKMRELTENAKETPKCGQPDEIRWAITNPCQSGSLRF